MHLQVSVIPALSHSEGCCTHRGTTGQLTDLLAWSILQSSGSKRDHVSCIAHGPLT
ncbi:rCG60546 [Rattus norvegicus]|uniref:RCG60546 n=1 Tax=Rattus norvegicus TaxID=10116 RepID=A6JKX3_RAT|nr:rCG60546 [Rattus norvegicus]